MAPTLATVGNVAAVVVAGGPALPLLATVPSNNASPASAITWTFTPAGLGTLTPTNGASSSYMPPAAGTLATNTKVVVTASLNGLSASMDVVLYAATPFLSPLAGDIGGPGKVDGQGSAARFRSPAGIATDVQGNVYVADTANNLIRKINPAGLVSTIAGTAGSFGSADGTGAAATFAQPRALAADRAGNLYVADQHAIRKISAGGQVSTFAGNSVLAGTADGAGTAARFISPSAVAIDSTGNIFVADRGNRTIRKITASGAVTTVAGTAGVAGTTDGTGTAASFSALTGLAMDAFDNLYIVDSGSSTLRKMSPTGVVTTVAGATGLPGFADGTGTAARFIAPTGVTVDAADNIHVSDGNSIRKVTPSGVVTTLAGSGVFGSADGVGAAAAFDGPTSLASDSAGNIFIADTGNNTVRTMSRLGQVNTFAGAPVRYGSADGAGSAARFNYPAGITANGTGTLFATDINNATIRRVSASGDVTTVAGMAGSTGAVDGVATAARFNRPTGVSVDGAGNLYVADTANRVIRKIAVGGAVSTLAGTPGVLGSADGTGAAAMFRQPTGIATDDAGNCYVIDAFDNVVRKITPAGVVTTLAGTAGAFGSVDGMGTVARFLGLGSIAIDRANNLYVGDAGALRRISPTGVVSTLAGLGSLGSSIALDGTGAAARFGSLRALTTDTAGNVYVADGSNSTIRKVTTGGVVSTVAGVSNGLGFEFGPLPGGFQTVNGIAMSGGTLYVASGAALVQITNVP